MRTIAALTLAGIFAMCAAPTLAQSSTLGDLCLRVLAPADADLSDPAVVQAQIASGDTSVVDILPCVSRSDDQLSEFIVEYRVGEWFVSVISSDEETGQPTAFAGLSATHGTSSLGSAFSLVIRCVAGKTELLVAWDDYLAGTPRVLSQVGTGPVQDAIWGRSDDNDTTFYPDDGARSFIESMFGESTFVARIDLLDSGPRTAIFDIGVMNADGSSERLLTTHPADDEYPSWSRDGRVLAFQSSRHGGISLWLMLPDGSRQSELTGLAPVGFPMFAPVPSD